MIIFSQKKEKKQGSYFPKKQEARIILNKVINSSNK
jgi:hypothetical protein